MRKRKQQSSAKKAMSGVKQRAAEIGATGGLVAVEAAESRVELTVRIDNAPLPPLPPPLQASNLSVPGMLQHHYTS